MEEDPLRYDLWIEEALRSVIRRTLNHAATEGLPGEHHFYITFKTGDEGVELPDYLRTEHPDEMTIVLQYQFEELRIDDDVIAVTLRFNGKPERLVIPLSAVVSFTDPSVNFGLQLKMTSFEGDDVEIEAADGGGFEIGTPQDVESADQAAGDDKKMGEIIALDAFRKK